MITLVTKLRVEGLRGREVTDFMLRASDEAYQRWWPGAHLRFHTVRRVAGDVGSPELDGRARESRVQLGFRRRRLDVPFLAHDLFDELDGRPSSVKLRAARGPGLPLAT